MFKKILFYIFLFLGILFSSCEDDPLLAPQSGESEDGGSYGNLSLPGDKEKNKSKNPEIF